MNQLSPLGYRLSRSICAASAATLIAALITHPMPARAAVSVVVGGTTQTFGTRPAAADWSTASVTGGSGDITSVAQLDTAVGLLTAGAITTQVGDSAGTTPPTQNAIGFWDSVAQNLQTRPTGVAFDSIMVTLQNNTGVAASILNLSYNFGVNASTAESPGLWGHRVYFSLTGLASSWTNIAALNLADNAPAQVLSTTVNLGGSWANGANLFVLWADDNGPGAPDAGFTLDNVAFSIPRSLIYNLSHSAGGAPNGTLTTGGGNYWLDGLSAAAFAAGDTIAFSQAGTASIGVPSDVLAGNVNVSAASGIYTIGGAGKITGTFTKSNAGALVLTSANSFITPTIIGGTVETRATNALGTGAIALSGGATLKTTTVAQVQGAAVSIGSGGAIIQTDTNLSITGINGAGVLTKTGVGALTLANGSTSASVAGLIIQAGKVSADAVAALGGATQSISLDGGTLEMTNAVDQAFTGALSTTASGGTISVTGAASLSITGINGAGVLTKTGVGALTLPNGTISSSVAGLIIRAGKVSADAVAALGGATQSISLDGGTLEMTNAVDQTFTGTLSTTVNGGTLSVTGAAPAAGLVIGTANSVTGSGTITKAGAGILRMNANQTTLSSNWIVNGGVLSYGNGTTSGVGSGTVTVNAGGRFGGVSTAVPNNVTLNGGGLATRSGNGTNFQGTVNVAANSTAEMLSFNSFGAIDITVSGVLSGSGDLTLNGNAGNNGVQALILTNTGNSYAGTYRVSAAQALASQPAGGVGSTLGSGPVVLSNATLRVRDNGTGSNGTLAYGNNVTVNTGDSTIDVDRAAGGATTGNTVALGTLSIGAQTLTTLSLNTYGVSFGTTTLTGAATFNTTTAPMMLSGAVSGGFSLAKTGSASLTLNGTLANSYSGTTTVSGGNLILSKTSGINAIVADLVVATGGTVSYGTTGGQLQDHIANTANITINGGTFGSGAGDAQAAPTTGVTDTVATVTVNSGTFLSGRNTAVGAFTVTGLFKVAGGTALVQRGGGLTANAVEFTSGSVNLDGGSTTPGNESRLTVGAGGLTMAGTTISLNAGPSPVGGTSVGSIVTLGGNLTSTGTSSFDRQNPTLSSASVDLGGATRTFAVTGTLTIGTAAAPITITNGALTKTGAGTLNLTGPQTYATLLTSGGVTNLRGALGTGTSTLNADAATNIFTSQTLAALSIGAGAIVTFGDGLPLVGGSEKFGASAVPEPGALGLLLLGGLGVLGRRRSWRR